MSTADNFVFSFLPYVSILSILVPCLFIGSIVVLLFVINKKLKAILALLENDNRSE